MVAMNVYPFYLASLQEASAFEYRRHRFFDFALPVKGDWIGALYTFIDPTVSSSV